MSEDHHAHVSIRKLSSLETWGQVQMYYVSYSGCVYSIFYQRIGEYSKRVFAVEEITLGTKWRVGCKHAGELYGDGHGIHLVIP